MKTYLDFPGGDFLLPAVAVGIIWLGYLQPVAALVAVAALLVGLVAWAHRASR